ncbi:unnamed protein product [Lampetra fluviatilis]
MEGLAPPCRTLSEHIMDNDGPERAVFIEKERMRMKALVLPRLGPFTGENVARGHAGFEHCGALREREASVRAHRSPRECHAAKRALILQGLFGGDKRAEKSMLDNPLLRGPLYIAGFSVC